jgi:hypothetical protein
MAEGCKTPPAALNERVVYDECHDPLYVALLKREFRRLGSDRAPGAKLVKKVSPGKSKADPRLQLADMIGAGVGRFLAGDDTYYTQFRDRQFEIVRETWESGGAAGSPAAP